MLKVAPARVRVSPMVAGLGVARPATVLGKDEVPACAVFVHDIEVVTVPALAGDAPSNTGTRPAARPTAARTAPRRLVRVRKSCSLGGMSVARDDDFYLQRAIMRRPNYSQ